MAVRSYLLAFGIAWGVGLVSSLLAGRVPMRHGCWSNALFILAGALWVNSGFLAFRIALEFTEGGVLFQSVVIVGTTVLVLLLTAFVYLRALSFGYFWERRVHERKRRPHA